MYAYAVGISNGVWEVRAQFIGEGLSSLVKCGADVPVRVRVASAKGESAPASLTLRAHRCSKLYRRVGISSAPDLVGIPRTVGRRGGH